MASVSIRAVKKHFGATTVIPGVDLQIADGEFVTLVGPSGCGKSTLLRMIAGLEGVSGGEIAIAGERVNETPPMHRDVAMVFQSYALYPHMNVERNMSFGLRLRHMATDVIAQKVEQAAAMLNLKPLLARLPSQLSGGQRQRVAMGRAMVRQPRVFLFDEPLSNLDAKLRVQMRTEIKALHKRLATTSIYVTHDQIEAMTMADRIVVMNAGRIEQVGTPEALYEAPDNLFVAGFIGSPAMNFLDGTVEVDGSVKTSGGARVPAPIRLASGQRVTLGIRPEHVRLAAAGEPSAMQAEVISVEPTGADTHIVCKAGDATITVSTRDRVKSEAGQAVPIAFDAHKVHCFDPESGASLRR